MYKRQCFVRCFKSFSVKWDIIAIVFSVAYFLQKMHVSVGISIRAAAMMYKEIWYLSICLLNNVDCEKTYDFCSKVAFLLSSKLNFFILKPSMSFLIGLCKSRLNGLKILSFVFPTHPRGTVKEPYFSILIILLELIPLSRFFAHSYLIFMIFPGWIP